METAEKQTYQPKPGASNRYENAQSLNRSLAEQINEEALRIVHNAESVLEKVRKDPAVKNFHHPKTGHRWMGHWLTDQKERILRDLYGVNQLTGLTGIPSEVESFVKDVYQVVEM